MNIKLVAVITGLVALIAPVVAFSSQPDVRLSDLAAADRLSSELALSVLLIDPYRAAEFSVIMPSVFTSLDVDADPFAAL